MSLKGFQKAAVRAPQTLKQRFNIGEHTKDAVYIDSERRFQELEKETKKLHDESKKYFDAINGMLNHQIEFSKAIQEIYKPISGRVSDPESAKPEGNPEGIQACEEYENIVRELQATLAPELEMIQARVIGPADELLSVIKVAQKSLNKRQHKQLDYDRHRASLKKIQDKKDKSLKDEKALYKAENDMEQATQDFNYFNDLLKDELPKLFNLEREFIRPLFQSFYYMQLNVFYTLHDKMQSIDIGYFNLTLDIEQAFEAKRGDIREQTEGLSIVRFKTTGAKKTGPAKYGAGSKTALEGPTSRLAIEGRKSSDAPTRRSTLDFVENPPPPYNSSGSPFLNGDSSMTRANSTGSSWGAAAKAKGAAPPPPKPKPSRLGGTLIAADRAEALYDYEAQAAGDLSFTTGDVIEIVEKGATENEWWTGRINGRQGQFPGLIQRFYRRLNHSRHISDTFAILMATTNASQISSPISSPSSAPLPSPSATQPSQYFPSQTQHRQRTSISIPQPQTVQKQAPTSQTQQSQQMQAQQFGHDRCGGDKSTDFCLVAEAAKRAQMAVLMRDFGEVAL